MTRNGVVSRRNWCMVLAGAVSAGCRNPGQDLEILPMNIGEWHRMAVENIPAEEHPSELKERGIKRTRRGIYQADGKVTASVYEFGAPAVAFEMAQKWRPEPNKIAMHEGPYFVVLHSEDGDAKKMSAFATLLEAVLKK